jgi:DNA-directed RNA polymerase subunit L
MPTMHEEFRPIAVRMNNADAWLINTLMDAAKIDRVAAVKAANYYIKHKIAKMDAAHGKYSFKHGIFLNAEIIKKASNYANF